MATFTYIPSWNAGGDVPLARFATDLGDGYEQRGGTGINRFLPTWSLNFDNRTLSEANAIYNWIKDNNADVTAFDWTTPNGDTGQFVVDKFSTPKAIGPNRYSISATFRQVPA